jgi:hypothetical protein
MKNIKERIKKSIAEAEADLMDLDKHNETFGFKTKKDLEDVDVVEYGQDAIECMLQKRKEYVKEIKKIDQSVELLRKALELHAKWEEIFND